MRPVIDFLNKTFQTVSFEKCLSVDEQMCATKARHYMKQYMPLKPHKWGYKLYVLSGVTGYAYQFEIYSGQENSEKYRFPNEPDLGASANNVIRLCRSIPKNCNYIVYFDNYYTGIPLMSYLFSNGILSLGTVRRNRLPNCKFSSDTVFKKKTRGSFEEYGLPLFFESFCPTLPRQLVISARNFSIDIVAVFPICLSFLR